MTARLLDPNTVARENGFLDCVGRAGEFIDLARTDNRSAEEEARLSVLKQEMADLVMAAPAEEVYDVEEAG